MNRLSTFNQYEMPRLTKIFEQKGAIPSNRKFIIILTKARQNRQTETFFLLPIFTDCRIE